ncbi:restriction endonuclease subunit S [Stutzerimonas stutzeri]|uniref:restriction endonuclease subunit S n=1 Tax=Stutzerimonas stutzeri TaxID=316 RepID=UPI0037215DEB
MTNLSGANLNNGAAVGPQGEGMDSPSTFPKYPAYKDSGVEWLGDVPGHWNISPLKFSASCNDTVLPDSTDGDYEIEYVEISDVNEISGITGSTSYKFADAPSRARRMLQDGDVLVSTVRTYLRAIAPVVAPPENLIASTGFAVVRPRKGILDGAFLGYMLRAEWWISEVIARSVGVSYPAINASDLIGLNVPVPAWHEQTQIARFLDHETARIDALIEEQQRLIELLKEKRQAVISHAVTKGLDPTVPMKDSGLEWLGEVPAHWHVVAIKWLSPVLRGASPRPIDDPKYFDDSGEYAWVRIADVSASDGTLRETTQTLSALGASLSVKMEPGEMFLSIAGTVGKPCITQIKACIHDGFVYFPSLSIDNKFLYRIFEVGTCYGGLGKMGTQLNLNTETVGGIQIGVPPNSEIAQILEFIDRQSSAFDSLIGEAARGVELLQERRSALISAAVTGKIDVRGWQPPASASSPELVQEAV